MSRVLRPIVLSVAFLAALASCTTEPGGGGVNLEIDTDTTTTSGPATTTTATTIPAPTTTSTVPIYRVTGKVSDGQGAPVARARVTMGDQTTATDANGWYILETTATGSIHITRPGWTSVELEFDGSAGFYQATIDPLTIRGLRVSAEVAGDDVMFERIVQLARDTAVNTLVFDTKREGGDVLYDTGVRDSHRIGAVDVLYDPVSRLEQADAEGLYTITRIVAFEDGRRSNAFEDERLSGGWLDPSSEGARRYILDLAEEACELGFDEIQFDYIRYPAGAAATRTGQLDMPQAERVEIIAGFLGEARSVLNAMGCALSADVFGVVVSVDNDQGLGQRPEEMSARLDALSPMVYPSHYSQGWFGYEDPNDHPYDVTTRAISDAMPRMADGSVLRPWLQAFYWTNDQIRQSIQAAEDHGVGWILWNVRSNFDPAALPTDAEVSS